LFVDKRFQYRYIALEHAWKAIDLMEDDTERAAKRLCEMHKWFRRWNGDLDQCSLIYHALLDRFGSTTYGQYAIANGQMPDPDYVPEDIR